MRWELLSVREACKPGLKVDVRVHDEVKGSVATWRSLRVGWSSTSPTPLAPIMAQDQLVEEYGALLEQLNAAPFQRDLHEQRIALASRLELADEVEQGRNGLAQYFPLSQGAHRSPLSRLHDTSADPPRAAEWTAWLDDRKSALPAPPTDDVTPLLELVELYRRASRDQLCALRRVHPSRSTAS